MRRALAVAGALAALGACGDLTPDARPAAPVNACSQQSDCEGFAVAGAQCTGGICVVPSKLSYVIEIALPSSSPYAPGGTVVLPPAYLNDLFLHQKVPSTCADQDTRPVCNCAAPRCLFLPQYGESQGTLRVPRSVAAAEWPWTGCDASPALTQKQKDDLCGLRPLDAAEPYTTLPSRVVFRALWSGAPALLSAAEAGLSTRDAEATTLVRLDVAPGPNKTVGTRYDVLLQAAGQPGDGVGLYVRRIDPLPPFDAAFPPIVSPATVVGTQGTTEFSAVTLTELDGKPSVRTFSFSTKGPPLDGWRVYLAARSAASLKAFGVPLDDGERLSTVTTMASPAGETVVLQTALGVGLGAPFETVLGMRLVAEPPPGLALPTFGIDDVDGQILPANQEIPALPAPVVVSGAVELEGQAVAARVTFESQRDAGGAIELADGSLSQLLSYRTTITTDATGAYSVRLPPGKYGAYVEPLGAVAAKAAIPFAVGSQNPVQQGRALAVPRKTHVHAAVALGDGRAAPYATVRLVPALKQPEGTNPRALPRPATSATAPSGAAAAFDLDVDPGVYDVVVAPPAGTRFPWVVVPGRVIQGASVELDPVVIPPPLQQGGYVPSLTIRDPNGNAVVGALVRVYAASDLSPGAPLYAIGETRTDDSGHFDMDLAGPPR